MAQVSTENTTNSSTDSVTKNQGQKHGAKAQEQGSKKAAKTKAPKTPKTPRAKKEKPARTTPADMSKVNKVAAQLPPLSPDAQLLFNAANNMSTADINSLVSHLNISIRRRGVQAVAQGSTGPSSLKVGDRVTIRSGPPRFIGQSGVVSKVQRIRCYVRLDGRNKDDYFFIADTSPISMSSHPQTSLAEAITRLTNPPPTADINTIVNDEDEAGNQSATG